jgi:hypothetical protein
MARRRPPVAMDAVYAAALASADVQTDSPYLLALFNASWDLAQKMFADLERMAAGPFRVEYELAASRLWMGVRWLERVLDRRPDLERIP